MSPRTPRTLAALAVALLTLVGGAGLADAAPGAAPAPRPGDPVDEAIIRYFTAGGHADEARQIAWCESSLNASARSRGGGNHGLFQINNVHARQFTRVTGLDWATWRYDADANAHYARWLFDTQGWDPWGCA